MSRSELRVARDRVTVVCYAQIAVCVYFLYSLGPTVPLISDEFGLSRAVASFHGSAVAVGAIVSGITLPLLILRFGRARVSWLACTALSASAGALCFAPNLFGTLPATALAAAAGTAAAACAIASLSAHHGQAAAAAITEASAVGSGIALIAPLSLSAGVALGVGWRAGAAGTAVMAAAVALVARSIGEHARPESLLSVSRHSRLPGRYWLAWTVLMLCLSIETCLSMWMVDELRTHAAMSTSAATASGSALVCGIFLGRLAGSRIALRCHDPRPLLLWALAMTAAGFTVFWAPETPWLSVTGLWLTGLGVALHYPLAIALAIRASAGRADLAAARSLYAEALAYSAAPLILAMGADRFGPHSAFLFVPTLLALAAIGVAGLRAENTRSSKES
ncbi:MFS transporter [Streptomyces sp. 3211]|uniref:MFS transporter n=1 Tax=Streptomyces sp. 3211 TaxID=1964449 RepID=UPI00193C7F47|nr:MFS transporter [Streptomyces sp. 3211]